jgi:hypothetical protein
MKNSLIVATLVGCSLFAASVQADDSAAAKKDPATPSLNKNVAQPAGGTMANKKATVSAEGADNMHATTGMKATGAALNKSEGANDLHN